MAVQPGHGRPGGGRAAPRRVESGLAIGNQAKMILDDRKYDATIEEKREFCVGTTSRMREGRRE